MRFPPIDLSDLDKDAVKDVLEEALREVERYKYVCVALATSRPNLKGVSEVMRTRIGCEVGSCTEGLYRWLQKNCPEVVQWVAIENSHLTAETLAYRIAWIKHMMEQVQ